MRRRRLRLLKNQPIKFYLHLSADRILTEGGRRFVFLLARINRLQNQACA